MTGERFDPIELKDSPFISDEDAEDPERDLREAESYLIMHPRNVDALVNKGVALGRLERYKEAIGVLKEAKVISLKTNSPDHIGQACMISHNLASFLSASGHDNEAEQEYTDAIDLGIRSNVPGGIMFGSMAAFDLAMEHQRKSVPDVDKYLSISLDLGKTSNKPLGLATAARAAYNLANFKLVGGDIKRFELLMKDAISYGRSAGVPRGLQTATNAAFKLAAWFNVVDQEIRSKELLEEAVHLGKSTDTHETNLRASMASDLLGDNLKKAKRLSDAHLAYRQAVKLGKRSEKEKGLEIAAHALVKIGLLLDNTSFQEAEKAYREAFEISAKVGSAAIFQQGATAAMLLGTAYVEKGQTEAAKHFLKEAMRMGDASHTPSGSQAAEHARSYMRHIQE
jgi:tetratricopeptide (TPR) repeat protein